MNKLTEQQVEAIIKTIFGILPSDDEHYQVDVEELKLFAIALGAMEAEGEK